MIGKLDPQALRENQEKMNKRGKIIGIAMILFSVLLTVFLGITAYSDTIQRFGYQQTTGTVTESNFRRDPIDNKQSYNFKYEYVVNGVAYTGSDSETGQTVSQPPSKGDSINVYYNPSNPSKSVVETNKSDPLSDFFTWTCCFSPIVFIFGVVFLFVSTRKPQPIQ
jgi:hypothetical protein